MAKKRIMPKDFEDFFNSPVKRSSVGEPIKTDIDRFLDTPVKSTSSLTTIKQSEPKYIEPLFQKTPKTEITKPAQPIPNIHMRESSGKAIGPESFKDDQRLPIGLDMKLPEPFTPKIKPLDVDTELKKYNLPSRHELERENLNPEFIAKNPTLGKLLTGMSSVSQKVEKWEKETTLGKMEARAAERAAQVAVGKQVKLPTTGNKVLDFISDMFGTVAGYSTPMGAGGMAMQISQGAMQVPQVANILSKVPGKLEPIARSVLRGGTSGALVGGSRAALAGKDTEDILKSAGADATYFAIADTVVSLLAPPIIRAVDNTVKKVKDPLVSGVRLRYQAFKSRNIKDLVPVETNVIRGKVDFTKEGFVEELPKSGIWVKRDAGGMEVERIYETVFHNGEHVPLYKLRLYKGQKPVADIIKDVAEVSKVIPETVKDTAIPAGENIPPAKQIASTPAKPEPVIDSIATPSASIIKDTLKMSDKVRTERGTTVDVKYAITDADNLITSHDTALNVNPGYPQELQPRDRSRMASEIQVEKIAKNIEPSFLGKSPKASEGAPIVGDDMIVESGNARVIALSRAYGYGTADNYKKWLIDNAENFGLNKDEILNTNKPVLVRVRTSDVDRVKFAQEANEQSIASMGATEQAMVDAQKLDSSILSLFYPAEDGNMLNTANQNFIARFLSEVIGPAEQGTYITKDGSVSQDGVKRIQNAIFAKAYGDTSSIEKLAESTDSNIKNITNGMLAVAPRFIEVREGIQQGGYYDLDISSDVAQAANKLSSLRESGMSIEMYLKQTSLFEDDISDLGKDLLDVFDKYKRSSKKITKILQACTNAIEALGHPDQIGMFGTTDVTKADILEAALRRVEGDTTQTSLFQDEAGERGTGITKVAGVRGTGEEYPAGTIVQKDGTKYRISGYEGEKVILDELQDDGTSDMTWKVFKNQLDNYTVVTEQPGNYENIHSDLMSKMQEELNETLQYADYDHDSVEVTVNDFMARHINFELQDKLTLEQYDKIDEDLTSIADKFYKKHFPKKTEAVKEPWQMTKEEFVASVPKGYKYIADLGETIARHNPDGTITLTDAFFGHDEQTKKELLAHEKAHGIVKHISEIANKEVFWELVNSGLFGKFDSEAMEFKGMPYNFRNVDEILTQLVTDLQLNTVPKKFKDKYAVQYNIAQQILDGEKVNIKAAVEKAIAEGKPVTEEVLYEKVFGEAIGEAKPETNKPFYATMYQGRGKPKEEIYSYLQKPIAGEGQYYAFTENDARHYGDKVTQHKIELSNPIVITNDDEWTALSKEAGWGYPNPYGTDPEIVEKWIDDLRELILSKGHDGLILSFDPSNELEAKILGRVFAHSQVVDYKGLEKSTATKTESKDKPLRIYYRGTVPGETKRISTGDAEWDSYLFVSADEKLAKAYGPQIEKVAFKPDAKILHEGSKEFKEIAGTAKSGQKLFEFYKQAVKKAKQAGYDAVHSSRQGDVGTVIINQGSVIRNYEKGGMDEEATEPGGPVTIKINHSSKQKEWVAEITGPDKKYKYKRQFLKPTKKDWSGSGKTGTTTYELEKGKIYQIKPSFKDQYFATIENGQIVKIDEEDVPSYIGEEKEAVEQLFETISKAKSSIKATTKTETTSATEPIKQHDIINFLSEKLDIPVRVGRYRGKARGIFKVSQEVVRARFANDVYAVSHEIGHALDKAWDLRTVKKNSKIMDEFKTLAHGVKGSPVTEGIAQFINFYITDPTYAAKVAPLFMKEFESKLNQHPDVKDILLEARKQYEAWESQSNTQKVLSMISFDKDPKRPFTFERFYTQWVDELQPLKSVTDKMLKDSKIPISRHPFYRAWLNRGSTGLAEAYLHNGQMDKNFKKIGPSLDEILGPIAENEFKDFIAYITAKRAIELLNRDINPGITLEQAEGSIQELTGKYSDEKIGQFKEVFKQLGDFQDNLLKVLVDSGVLGAELYKKIKSLNKDYVPFYRLIEGYEMPARISGKKYADVSQPIRRVKGSGREIVNPLESVIKNTYAFINIAERNTVGRLLAELAEGIEGSGKWVEKIDTPLKPTKIQLQEISGALEDAGVDTTDIDLEQLAVIFRPNVHGMKKDNIVVIRRDGKPQMYQLDPELYIAVKSLDTQSAHWLVDILSKPAAWLRAGATLTPDFPAKNIFRDQFAAFIYSKYGYIPVIDAISGLAHVLKKDDLYWKWYASGGAHGAMVSLDRDYIQNSMKKILTERTTVRRLTGLLKSPIELLGMISEISEEATRVTEFKKGIKVEGINIEEEIKAAQNKVDDIQNKLKAVKNKHDRKTLRKDLTKAYDALKYLKENKDAEGYRRAALASRDLTLDFRRGGHKSRDLNRINAFFNAGIQGIDKLGRAFREDPFRTLYRIALLVTLPSLVCYVINRKNKYYEELPRWEKDIFWHTPIPGSNGKRFIRIPKPFEIGILFGTLPERFLQYVDKNDPKAFDEFNDALNEYVFQGLVPDKEFMFLPTGLIPTAFIPVIESFANKSIFTRTQTVPQSELSLSPSMQYGPNTSEVAKLLGGILDVSPRKIDNTIRGYTGGLGRNVTDLIDAVMVKTGVIEGKVKPGAKDAVDVISNIPAMGTYISKYPLAYQSPTVNDFYNDYNKAEELYKTAKARVEKEGKKTSITKREADLVRLRPAMKKVVDILSDIKKEQMQIMYSNKMTPKEKAENLHELEMLQINLVRRVYGKEPLK